MDSIIIQKRKRSFSFRWGNASKIPVDYAAQDRREETPYRDERLCEKPTRNEKRCKNHASEYIQDSVA